MDNSIFCNSCNFCFFFLVAAWFFSKANSFFVVLFMKHLCTFLKGAYSLKMRQCASIFGNAASSNTVDLIDLQSVNLFSLFPDRFMN